MATVSIRLRSLLPRWMLATDPYVRVNDGLPRRLTKTPVDFDVPAGSVNVEVALFRSGHTAVEGRWSNPISRHAEEVGEDDRLSLWFHPALFSSYMRCGHLRRE